METDFPRSARAVSFSLDIVLLSLLALLPAALPLRAETAEALRPGPAPEGPGGMTHAE